MIERASHFPWPLDLLPRRPVLRRTGEPEIIAKEHIMKIAVAGATGRLGRHVAEVAEWLDQK
jgi:hypothetical protein